MATPLFKTKAGRLTSYAFACGYIETSGTFKLYRQHAVYHVVGFTTSGTRVWESFRTLTPARRALRTLGGERIVS